jgi:hypothetical protein
MERMTTQEIDVWNELKPQEMRYVTKEAITAVLRAQEFAMLRKQAAASGVDYGSPEWQATVGRLFRAQDAKARAAGGEETLSLANADWRNLYDMVYGHECTFKSFMATVDDIAAPRAQSADADEDKWTFTGDELLAFIDNCVRAGIKQAGK